MARGYSRRYLLRLTEAARTALQAWAAQGSAGEQRHAQFVVLRAAGCTVDQVCQRTGAHPLTVLHWVRRYCAEGPHSLRDRRRSWREPPGEGL
jgi:hypothetical protein